MGCTLLTVQPIGYSQRKGSQFGPHKASASLLLPLQGDPRTCCAVVPSHQQGLPAGTMPGSCGGVSARRGGRQGEAGVQPKRTR